jgi:hypothetical protein
MARNRVIYQSEAVFVSKNITSSGAFAHSQLRRIQSANYNYSVQRTDVNQYANLARIDAIVIEQPVVNLELTYLIGDGFNEKALGFTLEKDYDAQFGKEMFNSTFSGQNFYITTVEEGLDANLLTESAITSALANNNTSVIGIGNGYITNYSADFTVGALAIASVSIEASNIMSTGNLPRKSSYEEGYTGIPIASINPSDGVKRTEKVSLDFANAGLTDGISALRPGDVTVTIANSGIASNTFAVQSAKIAFPMSRESISKVGSRFAVAKVATFPIVSTITISATLGDLEARNLADQIDSANTTDITLTVKGGSDNQEKISYRLKKCKLDSESFSASIGSNKTVELTFSTQIGGSNDSTNGIFVNGDSEESPFEFYLEAYNNMPANLRDYALYFATYNDTGSLINININSTSTEDDYMRIYHSTGAVSATSSFGSTHSLSPNSTKGFKVFAVVHVDGSGNPSPETHTITLSTASTALVVDLYAKANYTSITSSNQKIKNLELLLGRTQEFVDNAVFDEYRQTITKLSFNGNNLTSLDTTSLSAVTELTVSNNKLTTLRTNNLNYLTTLNCQNNQLTILDGLADTVLTTLNCSSNSLSTLILSGLTTLTSLSAANNQLTSLNLTGLTNLATIGLNNNKLTTLTLPATLAFATNVQIINCNLDLTTLNLLLNKLVNTNNLNNGYLLMAGNTRNAETDGFITTLQTIGGRNWTVVTA